jgi:hypothetical protein
MIPRQVSMLQRLPALQEKFSEQRGRGGRDSQQVSRGEIYETQFQRFSSIVVGIQKGLGQSVGCTGGSKSWIFSNAPRAFPEFVCCKRAC